MSLFGDVFGSREVVEDSLFSKDSKFHRQNLKEADQDGKQSEIKPKKKAKKDKKEKKISASKIDQETNQKKDGKISKVAEGDGEAQVLKKRKKGNVEDMYVVIDGKVKRKKLPEKEKTEEEADTTDEMMKEMQMENELEHNDSEKEEEGKTEKKLSKKQNSGGQKDSKIIKQKSENRTYEQQIRTVFVGNLPQNIQRRQLKQLFQERHKY
eukprot:TRINITY_DN532_c0_g1_i1.p1 TRINITY_DN532_c0_g1~~TRINITY_DN532_c0_g1_i1.p1  ORF type:complete len:210 (-),score=46.99 TRINITY_DN532_c0_g1_i1:8-637(-)